MTDAAKPTRSTGVRKIGAPGAPGAGGQRPPRPAMQPPPPSAGSMMLRKMLMLGIIFSCLGLGGAIAWKLYSRLKGKDGPSAIVVDDEFEKQMDTAKGASKDIFAVETKVWGRNEELKPEDFATIKAKLGELRECHEKIKDLLDILRAKNMMDT